MTSEVQTFPSYAHNNYCVTCHAYARASYVHVHVYVYTQREIIYNDTCALASIYGHSIAQYPKILMNLLVMSCATLQLHWKLDFVVCRRLLLDVVC